MTKKPFYSAVIAAGYISILVSGMNWISHIPHQPQDNLFMPMAMLSLLVLSVALMAYLFFYEPLLLVFDGKREEARKLFLGTTGIFALFGALYFALALFIIPSL